MNNQWLMQRGISLDRLATLLRFAEAGSIVKAAGGDPSRQSLASRQIRELEEFFGVELVRRQGRGLTLTDHGRQLVALIRTQFTAIRDFKAAAAREPLVFSLAAQNAMLNWLVLPRLDQIGAQLPKIKWRFLHESTDALVGKLATGECDYGVVRKDALTAPLEGFSLGVVDWVLVIPTPLAPAKPAVGSWIEDVPLILPVGGHIREGVESFARRLHFRLGVRFECTSHMQSLEAVRAQQAGAVLPRLALNHLPNGSYRNYSLPKVCLPPWSICLAFSRRTLAVRPHADKIARTLQKLLAC